MVGVAVNETSWPAQTSLSASELFSVTEKLLDFVHIKKSIKPSTSSIKLLKHLNRLAEQYLTTNITSLIETRNYADIIAGEWPLLSIIKEVFINSLITPEFNDHDSIIDVYNYNNPITSSLDNYKHFPKTMKEQYNLDKNRKQTKVTGLNKFINETLIKIRKTYDTQREENFKVVNLIKKRQTEKNI